MAPRSFGDEAIAFVEAAHAELASVAPVRTAVVDGRRELDSALADLRQGAVVLGSLSSDLAVEVAAACAARGLVHIEAGALTDRVLGTGTLRLTGGVRDTARLAVALAGAARPLGFVAERSLFAEAVGEAIRALLGAGSGILVEIALAELIDGTADRRLSAAGCRALIAALRHPHSEALCAALARAPRELELVIGVGSWMRRPVADAARAMRARLVFCDLLPARFLDPGRLTPDLREALGRHLLLPASVYRDAGWAAGNLLARSAAANGDVRARLMTLDLDATGTLFGHGLRLGPDGANLRAGKAAFAWRDGELSLLGAPGAKWG